MDNQFRHIFQDWGQNRHDIKSRLILVAFRLACVLGGRGRILRLVSLPYLVAYRIIVCWLLSVELHWTTRIGAGFRIHHGHGIVIHPLTTIGDRCSIRHTTTIGTKILTMTTPADVPQVGLNVQIGPHVVILGGITVGDNAIIGAGSVVLHSVPPNATVAGNPARVIRINPQEV